MLEADLAEAGLDPAAYLTGRSRAVAGPRERAGGDAESAAGPAALAGAAEQAQ
jgi:hypothetical protein